MYRELFINTLLNVLQSNKYSILKYNINSINDLNEFSDIDIAIKRNDLNSIINKIISNNMILKYKIYKKSFMTTIELHFKDNSFLSIDLIYSFRRKNIDYIDINKLLNSSIINHESIKLPSNEFSFLYVLFFYHLNGKNIETKYTNFYENLDDKLKITIVNFLNRELNTEYKKLNEFYITNEILQNLINAYINKNNSFYSKLLNTINYILDFRVNIKRSQFIHVINNSKINSTNISDLLERKYRKDLIKIDSSKLSMFSFIKLKFKNKLKGHTILDLNKTYTNKNSIILNKNDSLKEFEFMYISQI